MESYDLIILGGGLAGMCAAVEAAAHGASVLLLEKQDELGGSTVLSSGYMAFAGTDMQAKEGISDSTQSLIEDMLEVGGGVNDPSLIDMYGEHQLETYHWLMEHGVEFRTLQAVSGHSVPRGHTIDPHQGIQSLYKRTKELSHVTIKFQAPAKRLLKNNDGRIDKVLYEVDGETQTAQAIKGVLIASGGFAKSEELLKLFAPHLDGAIRIGGEGNHGDGLKMAWEHGAWALDLPYLSGTYGFHPSANSRVKSQGLAYYKGGIIVNQEGKRFVNESLSYKLLGNAALRQPDGISYQIWDKTVMDQAVKDDPLYDFELLKRRRLLYEVDYLEELADCIDVPLEVLNETIKTYNEGIQTGADPDFGRKSLTHNYGKPTPIEKSPFYAFESTVAMLATYAGVAVDAKGRVLNSFGEPISGLFAAGEVTGGFHGAGYVTGSSLGKCAIFGRLAALEVLKNETAAI
ncbi:fumarate reductase flavoprotein subunit [Evansella vedderi]|uniref:Fumarate reductase flavoprotein subunit n=1 Tax=Evansella vedderi TaxID=38282 RepID=A0ABU0A0W7_9BACI|nr:flavocytochrome c [Evansella vedderi]MDQ0257131.1 fumarate reductase flavoprotein subunit [Evansella vedderi]